MKQEPKKMIKKVVVCMLLCFFSLTGFSDASLAEFSYDLKKAKANIDAESRCLTNFFENMTASNVEAINNAEERTIKIVNSKLKSSIDCLKRLEEPDHGRFYPVSSMLYSYLGNVSGTRYDRLVDRYNIPKKDRDEALDQYADHWVYVLDKINEMADITERKGIKRFRLPNIQVGTAEACWYHKTLIFQYRNADRSNMYLMGFVNLFLLEWNEAIRWADFVLENKKILTAHKLWVEFLLNNDLALTNSRDGRGQLVSILENIKYHLEFFDEAGDNQAAASTQEKPAEAKAAQTDSFKLGLPE
jgi:hypothetical protein